MDFKLPDNLSDEQLNELENMYIEKYTKITQPYRSIFAKINKERKERYNQKINSCNHVWEKDSDCFHNDKYYFCKKCGVER
jgi:hypothetical protein